MLELAHGDRRTSSFSACTAWARRCTRNWARTVPTLPAVPMRRSAAIAICWPIWCGACWRTAPIRRSWRSPPTIAVPVATLLRRPADIIGTAASARHPNIRLPRDLYQPQRRNSRGIEFGERAALNELVAAIAAETTPAAGSVADATRGRRECGDIGGARRDFKALEPDAGAASARQCSNRPPTCWSNGVRISSRCCNARAARPSTMRFPKSARPSISAATTPPKARQLFGEGEPLPGPTGESNVLRLRGRGVFVAIIAVEFSAGDLSRARSRRR